MKKNNLIQILASIKQLAIWMAALLISSCGGTDNSIEKNVLIPVTGNDTYMYVNNRGETMIPEVNVLETSAFYGNYAVVGKEKKGFIDKNGKLIIPMQYDEATIISEGLAFVKETRGSTTVIAIDTKGKEVFRLQDTSNARRFSEGLAAFKDNKTSLWGFVDKTGKVVIEPQFEDVGDFSCGLAVVGLKRYFGTIENYGFIDVKGKMVIDPEFITADRSIANIRFTADGYCIVTIGDKGRSQQIGFINTKGEFTFPPLANCLNIVADKDGFIVYSGDFYDRKAIYMDTKGEILLDGYTHLFPFNGGRCTIAKPSYSDEFIIIDRTGKTVAEIDFEPVYFITSFIDGMAVAQNSKYAIDGQSIINEKGEKVIDAECLYVANDYGLYSEQLYFKLN
jgi:hypothetical protein